MDWQTRRKLLYFLATIITVLAGGTYIFRDAIFPEPTCFDSKQNGYEIGVDCGGKCYLRCSSEVVPLTVQWVRSIHVSENHYDLVAMISNKNINNAAHSVPYTFVFYGTNGDVVQEVKGETVTPINGDFPIIRQAITVLRPFRSVSLVIGDSKHYVVNERSTSPTVSSGDPMYEFTDKSRVYVPIKNRKMMTINNLPVSVILYDENNNAYAVGTTVIPKLSKQGVEKAVFVWETKLPVSPTRIRVYPLFDPFLSLQ